jgi:hypothetical protein
VRKAPGGACDGPVWLSDRFAPWAVGRGRLPKPLPDNATARVEACRNALDRHLSGQHHIQVSARVERGQVLLSFKDIPEEKMPTVIEALMDSLSPVRAVA